MASILKQLSSALTGEARVAAMTQMDQMDQLGQLDGWAGIQGASFHITPAAVMLLMLNLLDGLFTLTFLQLNVAEELNPLMRVAYEFSPTSFMVLKLVVVSLGLSLLCLHRSMQLSQRAIQAGAALYIVIDIYHLAFLTHLLQQSVV